MPLSPTAITGLVNLRGQIATLIDLRNQLHLPPREDPREAMMVVVVLDGETLSLMVDSIGDVREVAWCVTWRNRLIRTCSWS